jgi:AraC family transcriptional regulator, exoenzyme S synthesis regulatory protein ExsA
MSPVIDGFEAIRADAKIRKFAVGDFLFAKYICPIREPAINVWDHSDHLMHVLSGRKTWQTSSGTWPAERGQSLFFKKGAYVLRQDFASDFCVLLFFLPDGFVRETVRELARELPATFPPADPRQIVIPVNQEVGLSAFLSSMAAYLATDEDPPEALLKLKVRELITSVLLGRNNPTLADYFRTLAATDRPPIPAIMEANFSHNLPLEAFARMCHRSLSAFKREFHDGFGTSPGRWLLERRLEHAAMLLTATQMTVTDVVGECGFEAPAHFSRVFKERFGRSPLEFRTAQPATV